MEILVFKGLEKGIEEAFSIRERVFVLEQNVPLEMEKDGIDKVASHVVLRSDGRPVGTGRVFRDQKNPMVAKIGRVAVLKEFRGHGIGKKIMENLILLVRDWGCREIHIHSQLSAEKMYEKIGFARVGDEFLEAGIKHVQMVYHLD